MTTTVSTPRLRSSDENWGDYIEYLDEALFVPAPDRKDYDAFGPYYTALNEHRKKNEVKSCVSILRALMASLRATDMPEVALLTIRYWGSGDSGEIEEIEYFSSIAGDVEHVIDDELDKDLEEAFDNLGWRLAYNLNPGFEISDGQVDGGGGTITLKRHGDEWTVEVDHSQRYYQEEESTYTFS